MPGADAARIIDFLAGPADAFERLYLESNSSLTPALGLYESAGFVHEAPAAPSKYDRADGYMVYRPNTVSPTK